ncbi:hypothetical protein KY285_030560 [Solanum tuberosum]|nr:hypothetical protein KY285_030560 [Solanum tuberosum]
MEPFQHTRHIQKYKRRLGMQYANYSRNEKVDFKDVVTDNWVADESIDVFISLKQKMKKTKIALSTWSRVRFSDTFKLLVIREDIVRIKEGLFEELPTAENIDILQKAHVELNSIYTMKRNLGDRNLVLNGLLKETRIQDFFHNLVNGRRKRLQVKRDGQCGGGFL